ncbi:MAG TPA: hypothetical protein VGQ16_10075 [Vicinamibacterales bacterium]|jgi:hypothetical protein|nr:hypothetical protein [Vicinamibacterales bacterium]
MAAGNDFVDPRVGLCAGCRHVEIVRSARSTFYLCRRSFTDERFAKYPQLPVLQCVGFESATETPDSSNPPGRTQSSNH